MSLLVLEPDCLDGEAFFGPMEESLEVFLLDSAGGRCLEADCHL